MLPQVLKQQIEGDCPDNSTWLRPNCRTPERAPATTTYTFRLVVRGTNSDGLRVRRVRSIEAPSYEQAWHDFADQYEDMSHGLSDVAYSVLPPVGWRVDSSLSKGFEAA